MVGILLNIRQRVDQVYVNANGFNVHLLVSYFGPFNPVCCVVSQKLHEEWDDASVGQQLLNQNVVVLVLALQMPELLHRLAPVFSLFAGKSIHKH